VQAGTQLYSSLMEIIKNMHNPAAIPLFFFRPTDGYFILQVRNADPRVQDMNANYRPRFKSEISSEKDLAMAMPLLCVGNSEAYQMTSDTSNIISHFTVTGIDRATSLAIKATAINPKWLALSSVKSLSSQGGSDWVTSSQVKEPPTNAPMDSSLAGVVGHQGSLSQIYGHLGYKRRVYQPVGNFVANLSGAYAYAVSRCWWLMRPVININNLTSYGIVDFYPDGIVSIELGDITYDKALLKQSSIEYDANEGSIISKFSVFLFPPWTM